MEDVSTKEGRTVLFVSHNMGAIAQLCNQAFLLRQGLIAKTAAPQHVIDYYLSNRQIAGISSLPAPMWIWPVKNSILLPKNFVPEWSYLANFWFQGNIFFTFVIAVPYGKVIDWVEDALSVTVIDGGSEFAFYEGADCGCVFADCKWCVV